MKFLKASAGLFFAGLLMTLLLSASECKEEVRGNSTAPLATMQKDYLLAQLKMGKLDEKRIVQFKNLIREFEKQEKQFLGLRGKMPNEGGSLAGKIIRLCPCNMDPDHMRLCPCPQPVPPTLGGIYDSIPEWEAFASNGKDKVQIRPETMKTKFGTLVVFNPNQAEIKLGKSFQISIVDKGNEIEYLMNMEIQDGQLYRVHPYEK